MRGGPHSVSRSQDLLADNGIIHESVVTLFTEIFRGEFRVPMPPVG